MLIDVPQDRVSELEDLVLKHHPEAELERVGARILDAPLPQAQGRAPVALIPASPRAYPQVIALQSACGRRQRHRRGEPAS
jgi:hypothetical protein